MRDGFIAQQRDVTYQLQETLIELQTADIKVKILKLSPNRDNKQALLARTEKDLEEIQAKYIRQVFELWKPVTQGALTENKQ